MAKTRTEFVIESGIQYAKANAEKAKRGTEFRFPYKKMKIGDSFACTEKEAKSFITYAKILQKAGRLPKTAVYRSRSVSKGNSRCWRTK